MTISNQIKLCAILLCLFGCGNDVNNVSGKETNVLKPKWPEKINTYKKVNITSYPDDLKVFLWCGNRTLKRGPEQYAIMEMPLGITPVTAKIPLEEYDFWEFRFSPNNDVDRNMGLQLVEDELPESIHWDVVSRMDDKFKKQWLDEFGLDL